MTRNDILKDDLMEIDKLQTSLAGWEEYCWQNQIIALVLKVLRDLLEKEVK